jgi:hypothetical protein
VRNLKTASLVLLALVAGCKQNPLPTDGELLREKPPVKAPVLPPLLLEMPESVDFFEGKAGELEIKASVPAPGNPLVTIEGLPAGATYDAGTGKLTWTPDFLAANDERDPRAAEKAYPLRVFLRSSEDNLTYVQRPLVILVRDIPRKFNIEYPKPAATPAPTPVSPFPVPVSPTAPTYTENLEEGQSIERSITVVSEDFPKGPFDLRAQGLPEGASLKLAAAAGDPSKYVFSYQPSALSVDLNTTTVVTSPFVQNNVEFIATDPAGRISKLSVAYKVTDKRMDPQISAPPVVEQGTNIFFTFRADDLNGEVAPKIIPVDPPFGTFARKREVEAPRTQTSNPWSMSSVRWTDIPEDKVGTSYDLVFHVCVQKSKNNYEYCKDSTVKVNFVEKPQLPPLVDRKAFPVGTIQYVKQNDKTKVAFPIRGQERPTPAKPVVSVSPSDQGISWAGNNLVVEPTTTGLKQLVLTAKSPFGGVTSEGLLFEVLPWSWSSTLILGESPTAEEVKRMQGFFENAGIANASLQMGDARVLALRDLLVVGTSALDKDSLENVETATTKVKNVMVLSPLVETVKGALSTELKDLKIDFKSRVRDLTGLQLEVANGLQVPADTAAFKLKGDLSSESDEPVPLDLTGTAPEKCKPILKLTKTGATPADNVDLTVAAKCQRKGGGTLIVSGVEWADIETAAADRGLIKKWMNNLGLVKP